MTSDDDFRSHEILLENRHLAIVGAGVLVLCVGAFFLGRWTERSHWVNPDMPLPRVAGAVQSLPIEPVRGIAPTPAADGQEGEEVLPPESSAPAAATGQANPQPAAPALAAAPRTEKAREGSAARDDLYIQVLATRSADAAQTLRERLAGRDYPVTVVSSFDPQGRSLYRVRVGGYASRQEAERVALRLQKEERLRTWIP